MIRSEEIKSIKTEGLTKSKNERLQTKVADRIIDKLQFCIKPEYMQFKGDKMTIEISEDTLYSEICKDGSIQYGKDLVTAIEKLKDEEDILKYDRTYMVIQMRELQDFSRSKLSRMSKILHSGTNYYGYFAIIKINKAVAYEDLPLSKFWTIANRFWTFYIKYSVESLVGLCNYRGHLDFEKDIIEALKPYLRELKLDSIIQGAV